MVLVAILNTEVPFFLPAAFPSTQALSLTQLDLLPSLQPPHVHGSWQEGSFRAPLVPMWGHKPCGAHSLGCFQEEAPLLPACRPGRELSLQADGSEWPTVGVCCPCKQPSPAVGALLRDPIKFPREALRTDEAEPQIMHRVHGHPVDQWPSGISNLVLYSWPLGEFQLAQSSASP